MRWNQRFWLDEEEIDVLEHEALQLLQRTGLKIESRIGLAALKKKLADTHDQDVWLADDRVCLDPQYVRRFLAENRTKLKPAEPHEHFSLGVGDMPQYYLQPGQDRSSLMTVASLVQATQFLDVCARKHEGVWPMVPGVPRDVPVAMQALTELMIGTIHCRRGGNLDTLHPEEAQPCIIDLLEALGGGLTTIAMFSVSPLALGGFEFDAAIRHMSRCRSFHISSLSIPGMSAPIHIRTAWVVSLAEALGGAAILSLLSGGKPVSISVGMFPFDVRHAWVAGGMPEHTLIEAQRAQITQRYDPGIAHSHSMTTAAHSVGVQAGIEKAANAQTAALLGCRDFNTIGLLGFDDIFSPEQCLLDVDTLALIEANIRPATHPPRALWPELIADGLAKGYIGADETLEQYQTAQHLPQFLDRRGLSAKGGDSAGYDWTRGRVREAAQDYIRQHQRYQPRGLDDALRVYDQAWRTFADGKNPLV